MDEPVSMLRVSPANRMMVNIRADGTIEYGEGYTPDETARVLWETIAAEGLLAWQNLARAAGWSPPRPLWAGAITPYDELSEDDVIGLQIEIETLREIIGRVIDWCGAPDWTGPQLPVDLARAMAEEVPHG